MSKRSGPNKENLEETRKVFLEKALDEFCEHGYPSASTSRIVTNSGMARGSLYYHFGDKYGLFEAIYTQMANDAVSVISEQMDKYETPWDSFMAGSEAFLDLCMEKQFRKIFLFEAQAAMPYGERLKIMGKTVLRKLNEVLPDLVNSGCFPGHSIETAGVFILGYLAEIGRTFDFMEDIPAAKDQHWKSYFQTMQTLKSNNI